MYSLRFIVLLLLLGYKLTFSQSMDTTLQTFPELSAQLLSGEKVLFPDFIKGKKVFITMVFEKGGAYMKPQNQSNKWQDFWKEELKAYGIEFIEIPMMSSIYWIGASWINSGMRSGIPKVLHKNIACFYGNKMKYANLLQIEDISECYACIVNEEGQILAQVHGAINEEKKRTLLRLINEKR